MQDVVRAERTTWKKVFSAFSDAHLYTYIYTQYKAAKLFFCVMYIYIYMPQNTKVNQNYIWACWNKSWTKETAKDFFSLLEWTLHALWTGVYPSKDWRGIEYLAGSKERDKAEELAGGWKAVVCAWSGDQDFYRLFLGLPNHAANEPCALCRPE